LYVKGLFAPLTVNDPEGTLKAFADHGELGAELSADGIRAEKRRSTAEPCNSAAPHRPTIAVRTQRIDESPAPPQTRVSAATGKRALPVNQAELS
jgi:hypothetical protein